jgi:hypothetical protein
MSEIDPNHYQININKGLGVPFPVSAWMVLNNTLIIIYNNITN